MIAVDASALLAIFFGEREAEDFRAIIQDAGGGAMSPVNLWEALVRAEAVQGEMGRLELERLVDLLNIGIVPATETQAVAAADAFRRFGKRTPVGLNLGDCFAYALASELGDGLLYKGDDFPKTDIRPR
jgi:ribonuclease VapC